MMKLQSRFADIVIKVVPQLPNLGAEQRAPNRYQSGDEQVRAYHALIYANIGVPGINLSSLTGIRLERALREPVAGLPLAGVEGISVRWGRYQSYLADFVDGSKDPSGMRRRLIDVLSPGLETLFSTGAFDGRPVRIWWSCETPELEDLPWELIAYGGSGDSAGQLAFVRGLPPESDVPIVPLSQHLRLAFIHDPRYTDWELQNALQRLPPDVIQVVPMTGPPRAAIAEAVQAGFELMHLVADGAATVGYDGVLFLPGENATHGMEQTEAADGSGWQPLASREFSALCRGSRVSLLGLSAPGSPSPDTIAIGGKQVPSAYRAFAQFASTRLALPSIVAPLGPQPGSLKGDFWVDFYRGLAKSLSLEDAMAAGRRGKPPVATALFLRHPYGRLFRRTLVERGTAQDFSPNQVGAELQLSREVVDRLNALSAQYPELPASIKGFIDEENKQQQAMSEQLDSWVNLQGGEA